MEEEISRDNIASLEEMVLDEDKLVTYLSLSKDLCLHVNSSKLLLKTFIENCRKKQPETELSVSYIVSGLCSSNSARTTVCTEDEAKNIRQQFKLLFYEHIYSVTKGKPKVDKAAFTLVNSMDDLGLYKGLITNNICIKRSVDEIGALKTNSQELLISEKPKLPAGTKKPSVSEKLNGPSSFSVTTEHVEKPKVVKTEIISPKKNNIVNNKTKTDSKPQKGIAGFFNRPNATIKKEPKEKVFKVEQDDAPVKTELESAKNGDAIEKMEIDVKPQKKQSTESTKTDSKDKKIKELTNGHSKPDNNGSNKNSAKQIKKNAKVDKKRKRVLHVSDSESEEDNADPFVDDETPKMETHESDDEIPPTPNVSTVKITSGVLNPKKRRKIVDKTYTDEEGYILTKKEEVYESCSDNEEYPSKENVANSVPVKKEVSSTENKTASAKNKKKIAPPQKGKQATLMSFFKKT